MRFAAKTPPVPPAAAKPSTAQLTDKTARAPATKDSTAEPVDKPGTESVPIDKPGTASAAEASTTDVQLGSKNNQPLLPHPRYHTPYRLRGVWQYLQPLTGVTPCLSRPFLLGV